MLMLDSTMVRNQLLETMPQQSSSCTRVERGTSKMFRSALRQQGTRDQKLLPFSVDILFFNSFSIRNLPNNLSRHIQLPCLHPRRMSPYRLNGSGRDSLLLINGRNINFCFTASNKWGIILACQGLVIWLDLEIIILTKYIDGLYSAKTESQRQTQTARSRVSPPCAQAPSRREQGQKDFSRRSRTQAQRAAEKPRRGKMRTSKDQHPQDRAHRYALIAATFYLCSLSYRTLQQIKNKTQQSLWYPIHAAPQTQKKPSSSSVDWVEGEADGMAQVDYSCLSLFGYSAHIIINRSAAMSFEVYLLHLEDIHRLLTHSQPICVQILSSEESELQSPTVGSNDPTWKRPYSFLCSEREKLLFIVKSLDDRTYLEPICSGYLNLAAKPPHSWNNVKTKVVMDGPYRNEAALMIETKWREKHMSLDEGLKETGREESKGFWGFWQGGQKKKEEPKQMFFQGSCQTRNLFSFLDSKSKGQYFSVIEKQIQK